MIDGYKKAVITSVLLLMITGVLFGQKEISGKEGISGKDKRFSVLAGFGFSSAHGEYPSKYDADIEISFAGGLRFQMDGVFSPRTFILGDFGYLKTAFRGHVAATDTYFYNAYEYTNLNVMAGAKAGSLYYAGGLYFGLGIGANSYQEYLDRWITLKLKNDIGLVAETGFEYRDLITVGLQGRFGLFSVAESVDIKNWAVHLTMAFHFFQF